MTLMAKSLASSYSKQNSRVLANPAELLSFGFG
jgi:hypothetical protein